MEGFKFCPVFYHFALAVIIILIFGFGGVPLSKGLSVESVAERYYGDVYKFCCAKCRDPLAAQDITQDTFLVLTQNKDALTEDNILAWLLKTAGVKLREWFKTRKIESGFVSIYDLDIPVSYKLAPDGYSEDGADLDALQQKILSILNENEKQLFIKLYIENKSVSLIREELDLTDGAFRVRKSRLGKKLRAVGKDIHFIVLVIAFKLFHQML
jgi:RNA polymerase sigma-70 factor (ECF subfamily)